MKLGRKIVYILSLLLTVASGIWGGFFYGTGQYYVMLAINGVGTAAYQALIQLTVGLHSFFLIVGEYAGLIDSRSSICFSLMNEAEWWLCIFLDSN